MELHHLTEENAQVISERVLKDEVIAFERVFFERRANQSPKALKMKPQVGGLVANKDPWFEIGRSHDIALSKEASCSRERLSI